MQKLDRVDLFCPHPFLRERSYSKEQPATGQEDDSELSCGLLTTTAFRSPKPQTHSPQELRSLVVALLQLWQEVRPEDVHRYAVALRPIVSQIFGMYLRNEFELSRDELARIRELGRTVVEHCRSLDDAGGVTGGNREVSTLDGLSGRFRGQRIGVGTRVAGGGVDGR